MVKNLKIFSVRKFSRENVSSNREKGMKEQKNNDSSNEDISASVIWQNFRDTTGFHGVNKFSCQSSSPRTTVRSICWISMWMASAVYLIYTVSKELESYYSYPTISNTYIHFDEKLKFPAITVCNLNPRKKSFFKNDSKTMNFGLAHSPLYPFSQLINWSDPFYTREGYFEGRTLADITAESKELSTFLYSTVFDNKFHTNFFKPVITDVGLCLRANADGKIETTMYGALFNLQIFVDAMVNEDYFSSSLSSGIKIVVHDQLDEPVMINEGFAIRPASEAFIEIQRKKHTFLPPPFIAFGNVQCVDRTNYSISKCYWDCWNKHIHDKCGCKNFMAELQGNETYCSHYKLITCASPVFWESITVSNTLCNCPLKCEYTTYDYALSTGSYPSEFFVTTISNLTGYTASYIRSNYIYVKIYYKDLTTTVTEQVPKYENVGAILANLGGQLGLFLGASVLTVTELMELLLFLVWHVFTKFRNRRINNLSDKTIVVREFNY